MDDWIMLKATANIQPGCLVTPYEPWEEGQPIFTEKVHFDGPIKTRA